MVTTPLRGVVTAEALLADAFLASRLKWSAKNYWLAFFGEPKDDDVWSSHFGGHHLAVNASLDGARVVSLSPTFIGIEPANYEFQGQRNAPLAEELADGRALMRALPRDLRDQAFVDERPGEVTNLVFETCVIKVDKYCLGPQPRDIL